MDLAGGRGKIERHDRIMLYMEVYVAIMLDIYTLCKYVTVIAVFVFVNCIALLLISEIKVNFVAIEHIPSQSSDKIGKVSNEVITLSGQGGF